MLFIPRPEHSRPRPKAQGQGQRIPRPRPRNLALRPRPRQRQRPRINIHVQISHRKSYFTWVVVRGLGFNGVLAVVIIILVVSSLPCGLSAIICYLKWRRPTSSRRRPPVQVRTRPPVRPVIIRPASFQPRFIPRRPLYF